MESAEGQDGKGHEDDVVRGRDVAVAKETNAEDEQHASADVVQADPEGGLQYKDQVYSFVQPLAAATSSPATGRGSDGDNSLVGQQKRNESTEQDPPTKNENQEDTTHPGAVIVPRQALRYKDQMNTMIAGLGDDNGLSRTLSDISDSHVTNQASAIKVRSPLPLTTTTTTSNRNEMTNPSLVQGDTGTGGPSRDPVEAVAIHDASEVPFADAVEVYPRREVEDQQKAGSRTRLWIIVVLLVAAAVVIAIVAAIACIGTDACRRGSNRSIAVAVPTMSPTPAPTAFPTFSQGISRDRVEAIVAEINSVTLSGLNLTYPPSGNASEELALAWLIDDNSFPVDFTTEMFRLRDRYAVATVYFNLRIANAPNVMIRDHCEWEGIQCQDSRVIKFVYKNAPNIKDYNGDIPNDIGLLTNISHLMLSDNHIGGTIPSSILGLGALTQLQLAHNSLALSLPTAISQLSSLKRLSLNNNNLFGTIPSEIGMLTELQEVELNNNRLTGSLPTEIGMLRNLTGLFMDRNRLTGLLPSSMVALADLKYFWIHDNRFSGTIPNAVTNWTIFEDGFFHNNDFTGVMPFCGEGNATLVARLVADCPNVECVCCTHCCPTAFNGIRQSFACAIG